MKFQIQGSVLNEALSYISSAIGKQQGNSMNILTNFLVEIEEKRISITATDGEIQLKAQLTSEVENIQLDHNHLNAFVISAKDLLNICRTSNKQNILKFSLSNKIVKVLLSQTEYTIPLLFDVCDFPRLKFNGAEHISEDISTIQIAQKEMRKLFKATSYAQAIRDSNYSLLGAFIKLSGDKLSCASSNRHKIAIKTIDVGNQSYGDSQIIFPKKTTQELVRLFNDEVKEDIYINITPSNFRTKITIPLKNKDDNLNLEIISKLIDAPFKNFSQFIPNTKKPFNKVVFNFIELKEAVHAVTLLNQKAFKKVQFNIFSDGFVSLSSKFTAETMDVSVTSKSTLIAESIEACEELEITLNGVYVLETLQAFETSQPTYINLYISDQSNHPVLIQCDEDPTLKALISPMNG